jgi:hypothetical protein
MFIRQSTSSVRIEDRWYYATDEETLARNFLLAFDAVDDETSGRQMGIYDRLCLYGDRSAVPQSVPLVGSVDGDLKRRNPVPNACDMLVAELFKDPVSPMFVTSNGSYDQRRNAERLTAAWRWVEERQGVAAKMRRAALDAIITGCGWLRTVEEIDSSVSIERVFPADILFNDRACVDEMPRELFIRSWVDRGVLWELYPDSRDMIESAGNMEYRWALSNPHSSSADVVEVVEGWRLPSFKPYVLDGELYEPGDGRWAMVIRTGGENRGGLLDSSDWSRQTFPIVGFRSIPPSRGFWGLPLIDRPAASGRDLNKIEQRIAQALHHVSVPRVWLEQGSGIPVSRINNTIGAIIQYRGRVPQFQTPQAMTPEVYNYTDRLENNVYKDTGVSQMSATSTKEAGLNSGRAIRIARETQTLRWISFSDEMATAKCSLAMRWAEAECDAASSNSERTTPYVSEFGQDELNWDQVDKDLDIMVTAIKPTSGMGSTPAARMQDIQDNIAAGLFSPDDGLRMSDDPDLESLKEERLGAENRVRKMVDDMLKGGDYIAPDPELPLERAAEIALNRIHVAISHGCPPERVSNVRQFKDECLAILTAIKNPPKPVLPGEGGPPEVPVGLPPGIELPPGMEIPPGMELPPPGPMPNMPPGMPPGMPPTQ